MPNRMRDVNANCLGVAMQVGEDVAVRRKREVVVVLQVAEGRQDATGVGVHGRPDPADAIQPGPLPAERLALLEDRRLEPLRQQPTRRDEASWACADHGNRFLSSPELSHTRQLRSTTCRKRRTRPAATSAWRTRCSATDPVELVWAGSFASHVELYWSLPEFSAFMDKLGTFCRIILFDKAGVGLSDPVPKVRTLDDRAAEIEAVMDAAGFERAALLGVSEGGPASILFAATRPDRTRALILTGATAYSGSGGWDDFDCDPAELRSRGLGEVDEKYVPSLEQIARIQAFGRAVKSKWGSGEAIKCLVSSVQSTRLLGTLERMSASPGMARATLEASFRIDVRPILPTITVPTLVLHARDDPGVPIQLGRYLADHIPGARMVELDGTDHAPWFTDPDRMCVGDRGISHREPRSTYAVASGAPYGVVHRYRRVDGTRGGYG